VYDHIIPKLKDVQFIRIDHMEADDIAFILTRHLKNDITIVTNDNDYLQMLNEKTKIVNLPSFNDISTRCQNDPRVGLLTKVLCGDPSDTIPGIVSKTVAKTLILQTEAEIETYMVRNGLKDKFDMNLTLIDMINIPDHLKECVIECIEIC
tara:strand:- start:27 stop:479 length:453 start_codon:yes stop_codon:yes gene_type:complete